MTRKKFRRPGKKVGAGARETDYYYEMQRAACPPLMKADLDLHGMRASCAKLELKRKMTEVVLNGVRKFTVNCGRGKLVMHDIVWNRSDKLCRECLNRSAIVTQISGQPDWALIEVVDLI